MGGCSRCKRKVKTRKVFSFMLCEECWKSSSDSVKEQYPTWGVKKKLPDSPKQDSIKKEERE